MVYPGVPHVIEAAEIVRADIQRDAVRALAEDGIETQPGRSSSCASGERAWY